MAKTIVTNEITGDQIPFFRGILVQSLIKTGLGYDEAYTLAQEVRDKLKDIEEVSRHDLIKLVVNLLQEHHGEAVRSVYENKPQHESDIVVHLPQRDERFSVGILTHSLEACAIPSEIARKSAMAVSESLQQENYLEIDHRELRGKIYSCLVQHAGKKTANRYLSWREFENSGKTLILLVGGVTGSGKSTLSAELAYRLDIAGMQSTDMMREIIRSYLPSQVIPTLMHSSFAAWRGLPFPRDQERKEVDSPVITGFLSQINTMQPALEAAIARAVVESQHLILEGVHVLPTHLAMQHVSDEVVVIPMMLATTNRDNLRKRFKKRARDSAVRKADKYLDHMDDIWELQSYLLDEADRAGIPIIADQTVEETISEVLGIISKTIVKLFPVAGDKHRQ
jgi:2-phosphoglycerate kinase